MTTNKMHASKSLLYGSKRFTLTEGSCDIPRASILSLVAELDSHLMPQTTVLVVGRLTTRSRDAQDILEVVAKSPIVVDWDTVAFAAAGDDGQIPDLLSAARLHPVAIFLVSDEPNRRPRVSCCL